MKKLLNYLSIAIYIDLCGELTSELAIVIHKYIDKNER